MNNFTRTIYMSLTIVALGIGAAPTFADFPNDKPVTMIIPFGAGGGADTTGRLVAATMSKTLGQDIIVKNYTGTAGTVGTGAVAAADPDGYTVGFIPIGPMATQPHLRNLQYGPESFELVCRTTKANVVLMTADESGINSIEEAVTAAKKNPGKLVYVASPGSIPHVAMIGFNSAFGTKMKRISGNTAEALKHIMGGVAHFNAAVFVPGMKKLGVFSSTADPTHPGIPTVKSAGADLEFSIWTGLIAPKGTPAKVVSALDKACKAATEAASFREKIKKLGIPVAYLNAHEYKAFYASEFESLGNLLKQAGLKKN